MTHTSSAAGFSSRVYAELLGERIRRGDDVWLTIAGDSMAPTLPRGARVRVVFARALRAGEVGVFARGRALLVHRVLARVLTPRGVYYVHVGDAGGEPAFAHARHLIGRADVPRRSPRFRVRLLAPARALLGLVY